MTMVMSAGVSVGVGRPGNRLRDSECSGSGNVVLEEFHDGQWKSRNLM
jgi:hypothetical protein